jgi:hypothetical protein
MKDSRISFCFNWSAVVGAFQRMSTLPYSFAWRSAPIFA